MKKPNRVEKEINTIRVALYEEVKGMSPSEMNAYMRTQVAPLHEQYGIRPVRQTAPDLQQKAL